MKLGIDVGGTKTKVAVLDDKNHLMETKAYSTVIEEQPFLKFLTDLISGKNRAVAGNFPNRHWNPRHSGYRCRHGGLVPGAAGGKL